MWTMVLAFMARQMMLDTGQKNTYLHLLLLPYLIGFLCQAAFPTDPRLRKTTYKAFFQRRSWHWPLWGRRTCSLHPQNAFENGRNKTQDYGQGRRTTAKQNFRLTSSRLQSPSSRLVVALSFPSAAVGWGSSWTIVAWGSFHPLPSQFTLLWQTISTPPASQPPNLCWTHIQSGWTAMHPMALPMPLTCLTICSSGHLGGLNRWTSGKT